MNYWMRLRIKLCLLLWLHLANTVPRQFKGIKWCLVQQIFFLKHFASVECGILLKFLCVNSGPFFFRKTSEIFRHFSHLLRLYQKQLSYRAFCCPFSCPWSDCIDIYNRVPKFGNGSCWLLTGDFSQSKLDKYFE